MSETTVDSSGTFCPVPIIEVAKAIGQVPPGGVVHLLATDPGAEPDLKAWCRATRHRLEAMAWDGGTLRATIRRGEAS